MEEMQKVLNVVHQSQTENVNSVEKKMFLEKSPGVQKLLHLHYILLNQFNH